MKFCKFCGKKLEDNVDVCDVCGKGVVESSPIIRTGNDIDNWQNRVNNQESLGGGKNYPPPGNNFAPGNYPPTGNNFVPGNCAPPGNYPPPGNCPPPGNYNALGNNKKNTYVSSINPIFNSIVVMLFFISFVILFCVPLVRVCVDSDRLERSDGLSLNYEELMDTDDSDNYYSYLGYMYVSEIFSDIRDGVQVFLISAIIFTLIEVGLIWIPYSLSGGVIMVISSIINNVIIFFSFIIWSSYMEEEAGLIGKMDVGLVLVMVMQFVFFIMGFIKICINPRKPRRYFNGQYR